MLGGNMQNKHGGPQFGTGRVSVNIPHPGSWAYTEYGLFSAGFSPIGATAEED